MQHTDRDLLRMHIEAVWSVQLPQIELNEVALLPASHQPDWQLCAAELAEGQILIWNSEPGRAERAAYLARLAEVQHFPLNAPLPPDVSREVALRLVEKPAIDLAEAHQHTCLLSPEHAALIEAFQPGKVAEMLQPARQPLVGVVVDRRLLSLAHSSRRTATACELGVDTLPQARRRGYALAATVVWSAAILAEGLTPIYSALSANAASLRLAAAAGYHPLANAITLA